MLNQTAIILVNTGTPNSPSVKDVRKYLRQFLGDKRVINLPWILRKALVNLIIAPFRGPKSAKLYQEIWTTDGSPLLVNSLKTSSALQDLLNSQSTNQDTYKVFTAMRYASPSMEEVIKQIANDTVTPDPVTSDPVTSDPVTHGPFSKVILVPMYPQYADSTTGSVIAEFNRLVKKYALNLETRIVEPFFRHPAFINTFAEKIKSYLQDQYDSIIFSFHGLPMKQTERMHEGLTCEKANCRHTYNEVNLRCYNASCHETALQLSKALNLSQNDYKVAFQSRLGMGWIQPYTDEVLKEKAAVGEKNILIVSPAFVADCLETIHELGVEYKHQFISNGGEELTLIPSLNDDPMWIRALAEIIN